MKTMRFLISLMAVLSLSFSACRDDDENNSNNTTNNTNCTNNCNTDDDNIYAVQNPDHSNFIQVGDTVEFEDVIVVAVDKSGSYMGNFWIMEPNGGEYSGVMVYNNDATAPWWDDLKAGDLIDLSGIKVEYNYNDEFDDSVTEIESPSVTIKGTASVPAAEELEGSDLLSIDTAEPWEGVLVTINNVRISSITERSGRLEVNLVGSTKAQDDLMDLSTYAEGTCLGKVTGVLTYFYGYYILPRSASDIEIATNDSDCPQPTAEVCDDGEDNDFDGYTDCADYDCKDDPSCVETDCTDGEDNDNDGDADCEDSDCIGTEDCPAKVENDDELCADGEDNDEDGLTDCDDPSCYGHPDVIVCMETSCDDNADNDGDGYTDCEDWDCSEDSACATYFEQNCTDNTDDDDDGYIDCEDNDCSDDPACIETNCTDTIDNDGDGYTDCADFDCLYNDASCQEGKEVTDETCSDGVDNDGNTYVDCQDNSCRYNPNITVCDGSAVSCADGLDNEGNGYVDCSDFACKYCGATADEDRVVSTCPPCVHE
ncbi:MAG: hypothetical protein JXR95_06350 [Deltaproteobacteria bacterium]|nr:hypothetical protein [Deltaproteobacteria bacterium]